MCMKEAAYAVETNNVDENGTPLITVVGVGDS